MFLLIILLIFCCGCSPAPVSEKTEAPETASIEVSAPSREAVFVYGQEKDRPRKLVLKLGAEPKLLSAGYLQLVGIVAGERSAALFELGGQGFSLVLGDNINGYLLRSIGEREVCLIRND
jgi:hypothetical protein